MAIVKTAKATRINGKGLKTGDADLWVNSVDGTTLLQIEHGSQRLRLSLPTKEWWKLLPSWAGKPNPPSCGARNGPHDNAYTCTLPEGHKGDHAQQAVIASWSSPLD